MVSGSRARFVGGALLLMALTGEAWGGSFVVNPVRMNLSAAKRVGSLTVRNDGLEAVVIQFDVVSWSQDDAHDMYAETKDVLATPPIFTVPPGESQTIRVGLRRTPDPRRELAYRLFLTELPGPPKPGFVGAQVALRLSVPLFVKPDMDSGTASVWRLQAQPEGKLKITLHNEGQKHLQIWDLRLESAFGNSLLPKLSEYVLPDQTRSWFVKNNAAAGSKVHLTAQSDAGRIDSDLIVESD